MKFHVSFVLAACLLLTACATSAAQPPETSIPTQGLSGDPNSSFVLTSTAFEHGEPIPQKYSCDGEEVSPPLAWTEPPAATQSLALIVEDPDAPVGTWDHWILFNISTDVRELQENLPITGKNVDPDAIYVGNNSWGNPGYGGPCPPSGMHRYFFRLYALDTTINLLPGATKKEVLNAMEGHVLAQSELIGTYNR